MLLIVVTAACTKKTTGNDVTAKTTDPVSQSTASTVTPTSEIDGSVPTVTTAAEQSGETGTSSTNTILVTAWQTRATQTGLGNDRLPWRSPIAVPFTAEELCVHGNAIELLFSTDDWEFYRSYMTSTCFVLENGKRIEQKKLQAAVDDGTITPSQLMAIYELDVHAKQAKDTASGEARTGRLCSFQSYREATVLQGNTETYVYPPYDFIGEFYADSTLPDWGGGESLGYYFHAAELQTLAEAACPQKSFAGLTDAEGIRVGNTLYVSQKTAEQAGIGVRLSVNAENGRATALELTFPQ